jgi:(2Fe-2S) ferredoxin
MKSSRVPYKRIIFVCTNVRQPAEPGQPPETACANENRGKNSGSELVKILKQEVKKRNLKGKIRVAKSGCMDLCAAGPNIMVFDENGVSTWYNRVSQEDLPQIMEKHLVL